MGELSVARYGSKRQIRPSNCLLASVAIEGGFVQKLAVRPLGHDAAAVQSDDAADVLDGSKSDGR